MATRVTTKKSGDEKPTPRKAAPKKAKANGPAAPAQARKAPRSRKDTIVNAETARVLRDAEAGKNLLHYPSVEAMFEDLGI